MAAVFFVDFAVFTFVHSFIITDILKGFLFWSSIVFV